MWAYLSADLWQHWSCLSPQSISMQWNLRWFSSSHVFVSRSLFHVSKNYFLNKVAAGNNPTFYSERFFIELFQVNKISPSPSYISYMHNNEYIISLGWMHSQTGCFDNVRLGLDTLGHWAIMSQCPLRSLRCSVSTPHQYLYIKVLVNRASHALYN